MDVLIGSEIMRLINALIWTPIAIRLLRGWRLNQIARAMVALVIGLGMWLFVFGGLTPFGLPSGWARMAYTVFTVFAAIVGLAVLRYGDDVHSR